MQKAQPIKPYFKPWHRAGAGHTPQQIRVVVFDPNLFRKLHWEQRHLTYLSPVINKSGHRLRKFLETPFLSAFLWFVSLGDQRNEHPLKSLFHKKLNNKLHFIPTKKGFNPILKNEFILSPLIIHIRKARGH